MTRYDVIIIGAGHNGLTAANYLARAGRKVCVLERRHVVGGAAVTEEFHPGYRNSMFSYVVSLLRPEIVCDLELERFGYDPILLEHSLYLDAAGDYLLLNGEPANDRAQFEKFSPTDYDRYLAFEATVAAAGNLLADQWLKAPPALAGPSIGDWLSLARMGIDVYRLDPDTRWRLSQFLVGAPASIIDRWFDSPKVKSMIAAHIMPANFAPLSQPGASLSMLHHAVGEIAGRRGAWGVVRGGMGQITHAMAAAAREVGVDIRTDADVVRIETSGDRVTGVALADGERLAAPVVAANTDPKRTLLGLLGAERLPDGFARDIAGFRQESASLRLNLALSGIPQFAALPPQPGLGPQHRATVVMIDSAEHLDAAFHSARQGIPASPPIMEAVIPSAVDDSLVAEPGHHVMSLLCKYMPYDLAGGESWDDAKPRVVAAILERLTQFIPNLPEILVAQVCHTPLDLERVLGMTRGDICHGRMEPDQLWAMRPHPEAAQYRTPIQGLYLCGSGSHPGGGVTGAPGYNAARAILADRQAAW